MGEKLRAAIYPLITVAVIVAAWHLVVDQFDIEDYILHGGYEGLARALAMTPEAVIEEVKDSGLRGRGGAYFPAGAEWESARAVDSSTRYLVVNAEEGEPGVFKDRHLMEGVPHRIIEGAIIAAYATGISQARRCPLTYRLDSPSK